jgi:hypothetical protein
VRRKPPAPGRGFFISHITLAFGVPVALTFLGAACSASALNFNIETGLTEARRPTA